MSLVVIRMCGEMKALRREFVMAAIGIFYSFTILNIHGSIKNKGNHISVFNYRFWFE